MNQSDDTPDELTEQEREALADQVAAYRRSLYVNGQRLRHRGPDALFALVESILAARVAAERERADAAEAKIEAARLALAMSDHEPTNRVWHEQMQRVRAALGGEESV